MPAAVDWTQENFVHGHTSVQSKYNTRCLTESVIHETNQRFRKQRSRTREGFGFLKTALLERRHPEPGFSRAKDLARSTPFVSPPLRLTETLKAEC
jgi:hypothetical protein